MPRWSQRNRRGGGGPAAEGACDPYAAPVFIGFGSDGMGGTTTIWQLPACSPPGYPDMIPFADTGIDPPSTDRPPVLPVGSTWESYGEGSGQTIFVQCRFYDTYPYGTYVFGASNSATTP